MTEFNNFGFCPSVIRVKECPAVPTSAINFYFEIVYSVHFNPVYLFFIKPTYVVVGLIKMCIKFKGTSTFANNFVHFLNLDTPKSHLKF
jgi:hypothetical protein